MLNSVLVYHDSIMSAFMFFSVLAAFLAAAVGLKASAKTLLHHLSRYIRSRMKGWRFLFQGPTMIQRAFDKSNGNPFEMFAPDGRYIFVSMPEHIKELDTAPDTVLSLQAASKQMLQPSYSMHGFNWFDRRGTEGVGFIKALRTLLTSHLPAIMPDLRAAISHRMEQEIIKFGPENGSYKVPIYPMVVKLVVLANSLSFFGPDLARNEKFMQSALTYVEQTFLIAEIIRLLPNFMARIVGPILSRRVSSQAVVYETLMEVAEERVKERDLGGKSGIHNDCIQWIMQTSPKQNPWSAQRIVFELMAIWFGSVHAMSTTATFAIHDLCLHPEYVAPLRRELEGAEYGLFEGSARGLPLLDSFIKESARLTPVESLSTRRQALKPFTLSNGVELKVGDWACTPVQALMQTEQHYPSPLDFNGFRFVNPQTLDEMTKAVNQVFQPKESKLTDVGNSYHVWGTGRMACPGRMYAAAIMKQIIAQVILNYDIRLVREDEKRCWVWRSSILPLEKTEIAFLARTT